MRGLLYCFALVLIFHVQAENSANDSSKKSSDKQECQVPDFCTKLWFVI
ncbi:MAG: hypothetical protein LBQ08_00910 [Holosporaceae bacterium]|jgi:hypothetical protein|nr:hypothetical protein [Holosporaceae bacterium]